MRFRVGEPGELGRGVVSPRLSRGGLGASEAGGVRGLGLEDSFSGEEDSFRGEEIGVEEMRGRLLGGSGELGLVLAGTAC